MTTIWYHFYHIASWWENEVSGLPPLYLCATMYAI